ncbi:gibberellin-regulated protein 1-like [Cynara cardunculus var. scolymus]|uniref:Gibberellin regulated protein n=1 Tax=Cynara cardunculus var. scolymus TaxID=59895 RepID=A0A118K4N4_CYNCS|nr:gibberellin-regulated protein 1-like [Cynara cardunculus var. scolymus]KVI07785.1 Gibberellin regulated protein [Cynara cardunculus var. scolymus]
MAISKPFLALVLLSMLLLVQATELVDGSDRKHGFKINCGAACKARCRLSSRPNLCHRACGTCCARCSCVPPGTSGNQKVCPCYYNMTTHGGKRKCP